MPNPLEGQTLRLVHISETEVPSEFGLVLHFDTDTITISRAKGFLITNTKEGVAENGEATTLDIVDAGGTLASTPRN